jgi:tRNA (guanine37-N1)-methyltransferase
MGSFKRVAFDIIGSREKAVAVITDLKMGLEEAIEAGENIMARYKHVKSVIQKTGKRAGKYRVYSYRHLLGSKRYLVVQKEYGYKLKGDPTKVHFSPREGEERERIAKQVKDGERILYLFSGVAPYGVAIAKKRKVEIVCIEWNKTAVRYARENVKLNKLKNIKIVQGDAKKCGKYGVFDRIIMPLGTMAIDYLKYAEICSKKGTIINLYGKSENHGKDLQKQIKKILKQKHKILGVQKVSNFSPGVEKVRMDILIG